MRTALSILISGLFSIHSMAQVALLDKASAFIREKRASNAIDLLTVAKDHVSTVGDPRTYYLFGFAYKDMFDTISGDSLKSRNIFRESALKSFSQCSALDLNQNYKLSINENQNYILGKTYNDAATYYNARKFSYALSEYSFYINHAAIHDRKWLDAYYYKGLCFQQTSEYDSAAACFEFLVKRDYDQLTLFADLSSLYVDQGKDTQALQVINEGVRKYPTNYELKINQMNILFRLGNLQDLEVVADAFVKNDSMNMDVLLLLATVCEKRTTPDNHEVYFNKLEVLYKKVLTIDATSYDANFNLGVLYYNKAVDLVNNTDVETEFTLLTKILNHSTSLFENALPYLLKAYTGENKNIDLLKALQAVYYNLNKKEELTEINNLIRIASQ